MRRNKSRDKIGRNDPCWCGSGKKYKKCHLHREDEDPIQAWQIDKELKRVLERRQCLAPSAWAQNCSSQISRAHTVPRSGSLARIARDGHVYSFRAGVQELVSTGGLIRPQLVGINRASTFTGFCSEHDRSIFAPVEKMSFKALPQQCFLLCYRALVRKVFTNQATASLWQYYRLMDRGQPADVQHSLQATAAAAEIGHSMALKDNEYLKHVHDEILVTGSFHRARAYVIELGEAPPVMCSGACYPEQDFEGHEMQDLLDGDRVPALITVTSFHGGDHGAIVLSWIDHDDPICVRFIETLHRIRNDTVTDALIRLLFTVFENIHIQPEWWESLSKARQEALMARRYAYAHPRIPPVAGFLTDDGLRFNPWPVAERRCVGFEL